MPFSRAAAALVVGLSPPVLAHATAVYPELAAGATLAGAVLCALRVRERPDLGSAVVGATLLILTALAHQSVRRHRASSPASSAKAVMPTDGDESPVVRSHAAPA